MPLIIRDPEARTVYEQAVRLAEDKAGKGWNMLGAKFQDALIAMELMVLIVSRDDFEVPAAVRREIPETTIEADAKRNLDGAWELIGHTMQRAFIAYEVLKVFSQFGAYDGLKMAGRIAETLLVARHGKGF